jgi:hypothetical protein
VLSNAEIIANPIETQLNKFRLLLDSRCDKLGISSVDDRRSCIVQLVEASDRDKLGASIRKFASD